jgi:maltose alpha-D-glucosyltransferase/alpha-amylase
MRKEVPEIGWGDFAIIATRDPSVLAIRYDWRNNSVLFVHNFHEEPREVTLAIGLEDERDLHLINLLSESHSHADNHGKHHLMLEGYGYRWFRTGGLDYLLRRSDIDIPQSR